MLVNSNVPRYSNLASELHRNYLFNSKLVLASLRSNTAWWLRCANGLQTCSVSTPAANMVKSYSFIPLWTMITTFQEKSNTYHISEPIIRRFFSKTCASSFTFEQFHWFIQLCNETLHTSQSFGAFFAQSCDRFLFPFYLFYLFSRFFPFFLDYFF